MLNKKTFKKHYFKTLKDILDSIDVNNAAKSYLMKNDYDFLNFDVVQYLKNSWIRAYNIYRLLPAKNLTIADVGGLFGNFSLCFARLGYNVVLFESYEYYDNCFDDLTDYLKNNGVQIENMDFFKKIGVVNWNDYFDCTLCLAVLEHIDGSPKIMIDNLKMITKKDGCLFIEVPNIASIPNRLQLLIGQTVLPNIVSIYKSKTPFMGHFHEYTVTELGQLMKICNLNLIKIMLYNYSNYNSLVKYLVLLPSYLVKSLRELILLKVLNKDN